MDSDEVEDKAYYYYCCCCCSYCDSSNETAVTVVEQKAEVESVEVAVSEEATDQKPLLQEWALPEQQERPYVAEQCVLAHLQTC